VKATEQEPQTKSGLYVPDTAKERPQEGSVLAVGPGRMTDEGKRIAMDVKVGDSVVYSKFAGTEFTEDGEELLILTERDILAIVK
jgi:chaperonin GroES